MAGLRRRGVGFRSLHVALDTTTAGGRLVFHVFAAGAFTDPATGYTKLGLRYYNAGQGRFTQQDEVVQLATPTNRNRYAYASCDPVNRIDPTGQFP